MRAFFFLPLRAAAIVAAFLCLNGLPIAARADVTVLDITAYIDGRDQLSIQGDTLQWQHFADVSLLGFGTAAVGRFGGQNVPTVISSTLNGVTQMDNVNWTPDWPDPPPNPIRFDAVSSVFTGLTPGLPSNASDITLTPIENRSLTTMEQLPDASNGYTLIVQFNDNAPNGPAQYRSQISFTTPSPVPEGSSVFSFSLLFALGGTLPAARKKLQA